MQMIMCLSDLLVFQILVNNGQLLSKFISTNRYLPIAFKIVLNVFAITQEH